MKSYRMQPGQGPAGLEAVDLPTPDRLGPHEVRVRVRAVSLNARDLMLSERPGRGQPYVPGSDGAGEVIETGAAVSRWRVGDRVFAHFFPDWIDGPPTAAATVSGLGGGQWPGMLAHEVVLPESAWVAVPEHLGFEEAATLPCAGVTAWNALFGAARLQPGDTVLTLGTGGVSIWALQLAVAAGLRVIVTSSDDGKLTRARMLGAHHTLNYRSTPQWSAKVLELTDGRGADLCVDVGGRGTLAESVAATRYGGTIALVGGLSGGFGVELPPFALIDGAQSLVGVLVGPRCMAERLASFLTLQGLRPVIDRIFEFGEAPAAWAYLRSRDHVGKVVIRVS